MKTCSNCLLSKDLSEFSFKKPANPKLGIRSECKACRRKAWSDSNKKNIEKCRIDRASYYALKKYDIDRKYKALKYRFPGRVEISLEEYREFVKNNPLCFYCSQPVNSSGSGLDRINNSIGYRLDNVLPCCGDCNKHRQSTWTVEEAKIAITAVIEHRKSK